MRFDVGEMDADAQAQQNPLYRAQTSSSLSTYTYFTEHAPRGFPSGNFGGGGYGGPEMFQGRSDMREAIQREIEKERIREEIIAEEIARKSMLEAEVRRELMMEREMMAMRNGGGFSSSFMSLPLPPSHNSLFEPRMLQHHPIGLEERIAMSLEEKYRVGGYHREIRGFEAVPFQRFGDSPNIKGIPTPVSEDSEKKVIVLGKPNGVTLSGSKRKPTPPVAAGSSDVHSDNSKKKFKEEWSCAICQVTAPNERGLNEHLQGKKHQAKEAALIAQKTGANFGLGVSPKKTIVKPVKLALTTHDPNSSHKKPKIRKEKVKNSHKLDFDKKHKKDKFKFWCEMCEVGAFTEKVMNHHKEGKKHFTNLLELGQKGEPKAKAGAGAGTVTCNSEDKTEGETKNVVVVEVVPETTNEAVENLEENVIETVVGEDGSI